MATTPTDRRCINCQSTLVTSGRILGHGHAGGSLGFRSTDAKWSSLLLRTDVRIPANVSACCNCGLLWAHLDAEELASKLGCEAPVDQPALVWREGHFRPLASRRIARRGRLLRRVMLATMALVVLVVAAHLVTGRPGPVPTIALAVAGAALIVAAALWTRWMSRAMQRRVAAADGMICPRCDYSLHGLDERPVCPECGLAATRAELRQVWELG